MTVISGPAPQPSNNNPLITSEAEHLRLIAQEVSAKTPLFPVAYLVAQYVHNKSLTNWHTALSRLDKLPKQIPLLHLNMNQIRDGICPISGSFYLIPRGTLNEFEATVNAYGQKHLAAFGGENPLQFRYFWARQDHGDIQFEEDEWRWMSDDILEGSRNQSYAEQAQIVAKLGANFVIPSLRDAAECLLLRKVATGESLLQQGNEQNGNLSTYTRVQDTAQGVHSAIGDSAPSGVIVTSTAPAPMEIGVVALQKF